jgi:sec-independent protein translocase protein TatA
VVAEPTEYYTAGMNGAQESFLGRDHRHTNPLPHGGAWSHREGAGMPNWIGPWEIAILLVIVLLVFGPKRLPELGSSLGKAITGFKRGIKDSEQEIRKAVAEDSTVAQSSEVTEEEQKS